ncbi:DUF4188 domain-containing protein [Actinacidiphila rubida]|uniref:DUF4188 domain-containing protein n=1 Tax=Actinacidiphila rubida TaxID=310780 RepID=A0A1H8L5P4_9ACTN|nr:DUF4188 domain-containing protein [Actinacidiphila rubida]SEN99998.1 protein of unknown function [Actinacidiphila rubida]
MGGTVRGTKPARERTTAGAEGDVVVFLIGMRVNRLTAPHRWLPVFTAMPRMLRELSRDKGSGLLAHVLLTGSPRTYYVVQYWESEEKLYAYASDSGKLHRPAWAAFNRHARKGGSAVGIWHETYVVPAGSYESIYFGMPPFGLAEAHGAVPLGAHGDTGRERFARGVPRPARDAAEGAPAAGEKEQAPAEGPSRSAE